MLTLSVDKVRDDQSCYFLPIKNKKVLGADFRRVLEKGLWNIAVGKKI